VYIFFVLAHAPLYLLMPRRTFDFGLATIRLILGLRPRVRGNCEYCVDAQGRMGIYTALDGDLTSVMAVHGQRAPWRDQKYFTNHKYPGSVTSISSVSRLGPRFRFVLSHTYNTSCGGLAPTACGFSRHRCPCMRCKIAVAPRHSSQQSGTRADLQYERPFDNY
jgi:hypothetical protein